MRVHLMDERPQRNGRAYTHKSKGGKLQKVSTVGGTLLNHQPGNSTIHSAPKPSLPFRLAGYDTPEVKDQRSQIDRELEKRRGELAKLRLEILIAASSRVHLIDWGQRVGPGSRQLATLLLDGCDIGKIAIKEGWAVDYQERKTVDWGDHSLVFFGVR